MAISICRPWRWWWIRIQFIFVSTALAGKPTISFPRLSTIVRKRGLGRVIQSYVSLGDAPSLAMSATQMNVERKGELQHLYLQEMGLKAQLIDAVSINLKKKCDYKNVIVHTGCDLGRINFQVHMNGTQSKAEVSEEVEAGEESKDELL